MSPSVAVRPAFRALFPGFSPGRGFDFDCGACCGPYARPHPSAKAAPSRTANLQEMAFVLDLSSNSLSERVRTDPDFPALRRG